jgi:hypothetical protein
MVSKRPRHVQPFILLLCVILISFHGGLAQYDEPREYKPFEGRILSLGALALDFRPRPDNGVSDSAVIDFRRWMPVIGFRQGPVEIMLGYTTYSLRNASRSTILLSAQFSQDIPLAGKRPQALILPVMVTADFTKAEGTGYERENFNIASVGLGAGLKYRYYTGGIEFSMQVAEAAHFSSEGLSTGSGFSALTTGYALVVLHQTLVFEGLAVGYRFRYQTWAMDNNRFNYRSLSHGPFLGILF